MTTNEIIDKLAGAKKDCPACPTWYDSNGTPCPVCGRPGDEDYDGKVSLAPWATEGCRRRKAILVPCPDDCPITLEPHLHNDTEHQDDCNRCNGSGRVPNYNMTESEALAGLTPWETTKAMSLWISRNNQLGEQPSSADIRLGIFQAIADVLGVK